MKVADAKAESRTRLETTARRVHADSGRGKGIVGRKHERAPVLAACVGCVGRSSDKIVPF